VTKIFTILVGQNCRSALNFWAAQPRRPTNDAKIFVLRPKLLVCTIPDPACLLAPAGIG
jgi:hypothetical protein